MDFEAGERIMLEYPLIEAVAHKSIPAYMLVQKLKQDGYLELPAIFYWAALCSLTAQQITGSNCPSWQVVPAQTQVQALLLHAPEEECQKASESVCKLISALWPAGAGPDALLLERILQVWIYNSFDLADGDGTEAGVMFLSAAMMSHSCSSNAAWHLDDANNFILHARRAIDEGDEITISYLSPDDLCLPTLDRCELLSATKGFWCTCQRCSEPRDAARVFRCPRCNKHGVFALAQQEMATAESCSSSAVDSKRDATLACTSCGPLSDAEASPLLAAEAQLRPWARSRPQFQVLGKDGEEAACGEKVPCGSSAELLQFASDSGLSDRHWILDTVLAWAAEQEPAQAPDLFRRRLAVHEEGLGHCITKRARLQLALGEKLCARGSYDDLREAAKAYGEAAAALAMVFGDDHREHQEAADLQAMARRKLAMLPNAAGKGSLQGSAGQKQQVTQKRGGYPAGKKRR
eukprot:TRINITY_DN105647_c0_g1_i1.p1 TRINITY_DN105647_c0_g1~~TRINITY_DN105647_c0_g1_i1.p1  ORF type:complete len:511 (+),score=92.24 TRINITY_DN105647_c0_g1_i1:142-1533(+)